MQGLVARDLTLEEIWNVDVNYVKVTAAKVQVKVSAESVHCKVALYVRRYRKSTQNVSKSLEHKI